MLLSALFPSFLSVQGNNNNNNDNISLFSILRHVLLTLHYSDAFAHIDTLARRG
jgi:hypothetical protein